MYIVGEILIMLHETYLSDSYYLSSTDILVYNSIFFFFDGSITYASCLQSDNVLSDKFFQFNFKISERN